jgi:hypothetical protein
VADKVPLVEETETKAEVGTLIDKSWDLAYAIKTIENEENWADGFYHLLDVDINREDAVKVARQYLDDSNIEKRLLASDILLRLGERSDIANVLLELILLNSGGVVGSDSPIQSKALNLIVQYRLKEVLPTLRGLLQGNEKRYKLYPSLAALGDQSILPEIKNRIDIKGGYQKQLGLLRCSDCVEYLASSFEEAPEGKRKKTVAAWAMLRSGGVKEPYLSYLINQAQVAVATVPKIKGLTARNESVVAFEYLASLDFPEVQEYLESSLDSENRAIIDEAMANLILRFDSPKARSNLLKSLDNKDNILSDELKYRLASALDVEITVPRGDNTEFAWKYLVHQKDWSIYNWVHNYTLDYWD